MCVNNVCPICHEEFGESDKNIKDMTAAELEESRFKAALFREKKMEFLAFRPNMDINISGNGLISCTNCSNKFHVNCIAMVV